MKKKYLVIILTAVAVVAVLTFVLLQKNTVLRREAPTAAVGGPSDMEPGEFPEPGGDEDDRMPPDGMEPPDFGDWGGPDNRSGGGSGDRPGSDSGNRSGSAPGTPPGGAPKKCEDPSTPLRSAQDDRMRCARI